MIRENILIFFKESTSDKVQFSDEEVIMESSEVDESESDKKSQVKGPMVLEIKPKEEQSNEEEDKDSINYIGSWQRIGLIVDGIPKEFAADILIFQKDSFVSSTVICTAQGKLSVAGNQLTMYDLTSNCPAPSPGKMTYTLSISYDDNTLTMTTVYGGTEIREVYKRTK